jgi:hypothetical protein
MSVIAVPSPLLVIAEIDSGFLSTGDGSCFLIGRRFTGIGINPVFERS